jgi:hypothetical protein
MVIKMQDVLGSIGVRKALPFTKFLNYELNKLRGLGVIQKNAFAAPEQNCPLNENPLPITIFKMVFLFSVFIIGGTLSIIIFIFERAVSRQKDGILENTDGRQCKTTKGRIPKTSEIGVQCNIRQSVAIGTKNLMIH